MNQLLRWKVALYLLAIFAAGSVSGWVLGTRNAKEKMLRPPPPGEIANILRKDIKDQLQLSPEQSAKIDGIIDRFSAEMKPMMDAHMNRVRAAVSNRNAQISAVLTPEQQAKFEELEKQRREQWRARHRGGPRHGPPGAPPPKNGTNGPESPPPGPPPGPTTR